MILINIPGVLGDSTITGFEKEYFSAESLGFGHERELTDSGKSGTADINVGVVEFQEVSISKTFDAASTGLARKAIAGSSCGTVDIKFVQTITDDNEDQQNVVFLQMKLDNVFVKTWGISGDEDERPTEEVTLWYNKIAFSYFNSPDAKTFDFSGICSWDKATQQPWNDGADALSAKAETHSAT